MTVLTDYVTSASEEKASWLGQIVFVTIGDSTVQHSVLAAELEAAGLKDFTPRPPADSDVFRRVFQNGQRRQHNTDDPNVTINLLVRPMDSGDGKIFKRIVVEEVDRNGRTLGYTEAVETIYDSEHPDNIRVRVIDPNADSKALQLAAELAAEYREKRGAVNGQAVRDVVKRALDSALAINLKGGVAFVSEAQSAVVDSVEQLNGKLPACEVHSLPLIDTGKQRDLVKRSFEDETVGELDRLNVELTELAQKNEKPSARALSSLTNRRQRLMERMQSYSTLLEDNLDTTAFKMRVLEKKMSNLVAGAMSAVDVDPFESTV